MILCIGEAVIDLFQTDIPGSGKAFLPMPGGCAYNTSIAIAKLDVASSFAGRLSANFFGEMQAVRLRENNVNMDHLTRCEQNPVLAFIKTEEGKEPEYAFYEEGTADRSLSIDDLPKQLSKDTNCIVFGSISTVMEPIGSTIELFIIKESRKVVTSFDPNIRPFVIKDRDAYLRRFKRLVAISTIVKLSHEDYEYIEPKKKPEDVLKKLIDMGTRLAIITLGNKGAKAMLKHDDGSIITASVAENKIPKIVDTVGAGDTFHGAFLAWLEKKGKLSYNEIINLSENVLYNALFYANRAASIVCTRTGAEPPTFTEAENMSF